MPWVDLSKYDSKKIKIVPEDGPRGYLIRQHWSAWVPFWIYASVFTVASVVGFVAAYRRWHSASLTSDVVWSAIGAVLLSLIFHTDLFGYWNRSRKWVLVTRKNLFVSHNSKGWEHIVNDSPLASVKTLVDGASWVFPSARIFDAYAGELLLAHMSRAAGGDEIEHAIETLRAEK